MKGNFMQRVLYSLLYISSNHVQLYFLHFTFPSRLVLVQQMSSLSAELPQSVPGLLPAAGCDLRLPGAEQLIMCADTGHQAQV